ncbi:DUF6079 family protein [Polyangium spumosum]|uniref:Phage resistance protein n=1 Tax=Polyangium spumosum TaxID=889282 RepID=A0A6N7Q253_9BACT|nr:DUF6079 family protein [Polyangium spumosum]MRG98408.1 hypothetical protein [Polyangium spumosum]
MTQTILDAFDLPTRDQITALGFVVRLEAEGAEATRRRLVDEYVLTPAVREELPRIFDGMRRVFQRGEELGRFIHGSFGSGKSHFMSFLGMLLEDDSVAWKKRDPLVGELDKSHRAWIRDAHFLVVRLHMLTTSHTDTGFDRAVYEACNVALRHHGKPAFEFLDVQGVLDEALREAEQYGDIFWSQLERAGIVASKDDFQTMAQGSLEEREDLARAYLSFKGRDAASAGIDPNWAEGLQRLTRHVKAQGFGGLVLLVDELLLWLSEKTGPEFKRAINQLNVLVDHTDGRRALPLFVFVARQRNIREFFPDMVQEDGLHQHLDHHAKRFELTTLQDVELRHICRERVLRRKAPDVVQPVIDALAEGHKKLLPTLLQGADVAYLRDVYPFHPALIEMLIDVSTLMQRERTALRLLYELLIVHYPTLPVGEFLPVGSAFEAIFPESGVEGSERRESFRLLKAIHELYYQRFRPAMGEMKRRAEEEKTGFDDKRRRVLDQLVKTVLLAEVSPRLRGSGGMSVERLVQLNDVDVPGEMDKARMERAYQDLVELSRRVPALQLTGKSRSAVVGVVLQGANFGEVMDRARSKMDTVSGRAGAFYRVFSDMLGPKKELVFASGENNEHALRMKWRGTMRKGSLALRNIRELSNAAFKPADGDEFRILIDYPWDAPGHTVEEDRQRARDARKREGAQFTLCWLPRHLTPSEESVLADLAAAQYIASPVGQEDLLGNLAMHDRQQVVEQASKHEANLVNRLRDILREVYKNHGEVVPLNSDVKTDVPEPELDKNLERFAHELLDKRYSQHPSFGMEPRPEDLQKLCDWMVEAAESEGQRKHFDEATAKVLRGLGIPLELVDIGQTTAGLRRDTRYLKAVSSHATEATVRWDTVNEQLVKEFGLQPAVCNFFLAFLARAYGFRALHTVTRETLEVKIDSKLRTSVTLERAPLLELAEWSRLRELGPSLFEGQAPASHRTLAEQDRYARHLRELATKKRIALEGLHGRIRTLLGEGEPPPRLRSIRDALQRLSPLASSSTDSCTVLRELLIRWPDDTADPVRVVVRSVECVQRALEGLDEKARNHLGRIVGHSALGDDVRAHFETLHELLGTEEHERSLTDKAIASWNAEAHRLIEEVLRQTPPLTNPSARRPSPMPPAPDATVGFSGGKATGPSEEWKVILAEERLQAGDGDALTAFWRRLREKLQEQGAAPLEIEIRVRVKK